MTSSLVAVGFRIRRHGRAALVLVVALLPVLVGHLQERLDLALGDLLQAHLAALTGLAVDRPLLTDDHLQRAQDVPGGLERHLLQPFDGPVLDCAQNLQVPLGHLLERLSGLLRRARPGRLLELAQACRPVLLGGELGDRLLADAEVRGYRLVRAARAEREVVLEGVRGDLPVHDALLSAATASKVLPSSVACFPVAICQRWIVPSTKAGWTAIARHRRRSFSAAMICEPEPQKGSSTTSPARVCCSIGISKRRVGFEVGWKDVIRCFPSQSASHTVSSWPTPCFGLLPFFQPKAHGSCFHR